jgi:hypothetical protein
MLMRRKPKRCNNLAFIEHNRTILLWFSMFVVLVALPAFSLADTTVGGTISTDTIWTVSGSPYIVTSTITVQGTDGADGITTLTIEPGVQVKFNSGLYIAIGYTSGSPGALVAQGTSVDPIVFTSNLANPSPGDWKGIRFFLTADPVSTIMEYCRIQYAGNAYGVISIKDASPSFNQIIVENSGGYDLFYRGVVGGTVSNCTLNTGVYLLATSTVSFSGNTFNYNNNYPITAYADNVHSLVNNNTFANLDGASYLEVDSGNITKDATWTSAIPLQLDNNILVQGTDGADGVTTLTISPGATLQFNQGKYLRVGATSGNPGALAAQGTAADPIVFTSNQPTPSAGDWAGIQFYSTTNDASTILEHCLVRYADSGYGAIYVYWSAPTISNTTIENSGPYDLYYSGNVGGAVSGCTLNSSISLLVANSVAFDGNTFNYNNSYPFKSYADNVHNLVDGNTFANLDGTSYLEVTSGNITKDATWTSAIPLQLSTNVVVQGSDGADNITTLTIAAGAKLKFNPNGCLTIGASTGDKGALVAQGEADNLIVLTSNQTTASPGDWYGLQFYNTADDSTSIMSHVIVEYAGSAGTGAIYLVNAKPSFSHSTIRYSSSSGIYLTGSGSSDTEISCNTIENNNHGIYCSGGALPLIHDNNFTSNSGYAVYNVNSATVNAEANWWGDPQGPNTGGDSTYGDVDADPWSLEENICITAGDNHSPNIPDAPSPSDNAVRVALSSGSVSLQWSGGDPDVIDTVTYDLKWGATAETLELAAQDISGSQYQVSDLGAETIGPVWRFTTAGDSPDLIVSNLTTEPAGHLQSGQSVTFHATIQNTGTGPVVDPFEVDLLINDSSIGSVEINSIIYAGGSLEASWTWSYTGGDPSIEVRADSQNQVSETNEENNSYIAWLSEVADNTAPALVSTSPADGIYIQQVQQVSAILSDSQSSVDDAAVIAGFSVKDAAQNPIAGSVTESSDTFTFMPSSGQLEDGQYQAALTAVDYYGNTQTYSFTFIVDRQPPAKPVITGGTVTSGTIQVRPEENTTNQFIIELTGSREAGTCVWINDNLKVAIGDDDWSVPVILQPGENSIEIWLVDRAGNRGESEWVDIEVITANESIYEYDAAGRLKNVQSNQ